jgi:hypothetical protein
MYGRGRAYGNERATAPDSEIRRGDSGFPTAAGAPRGPLRRLMIPLAFFYEPFSLRHSEAFSMADLTPQQMADLDNAIAGLKSAQAAATTAEATQATAAQTLTQATTDKATADQGVADTQAALTTAEKNIYSVVLSFQPAA